MNNIKKAAEEVLRKALIDPNGYFYHNQVNMSWSDMESVFNELSPFGKRLTFERYGTNPIFQINDWGRYFISTGGWSKKESRERRDKSYKIWTIVIPVLTLLATLYFGYISSCKTTSNDVKVPDKRTQLYYNLINSHKVTSYEIGSLNEFKKAVYDENTSREFYRNISSIFTEEEIGTEEDFINSIKDDFK